MLPWLIVIGLVCFILGVILGGVSSQPEHSKLAALESVLQATRLDLCRKEEEIKHLRSRNQAPAQRN
jgi:hypothetical protein